MGFYIRKAVSVGPFRFNLSKSGIGVSAGLRGLRVGAGPRGNYVHMGRGGLYFRQTLSPAGARPLAAPALPQAPMESIGEFHDIDSTDAGAMTDASSASLLAELNDKRGLARQAPIVVIVGIVLVIAMAALDAELWAVAAVIAVVCGCWLLARSRDTLRKTTVILYDLEPDIAKQFEDLHSAFSLANGCGGKWHIGAQAMVNDGKYHAGASSLIRRKAITVRAGQPPDVKCNIDAPLLPVGTQTLAFMPDRVLVFDPKGVGAVSYADLMVERSTTRFIESDSVPADAIVVGQTWQYVNKRGGPDKRFKGNRELPICAYEDVRFTSPSGLTEVVQLSAQGAGQAVIEAVAGIRGAVAAAPSAAVVG